MAQRHSGLSERSNLVVSVSTEVETGTTSSPPQKIKVVVCFIKIPPLGTRFSRPLRGGVTTRLVDQPEQKTQGGSVIAERAGLIELTCSGAKLGLRQSGRMSRQIGVQERIKCQCKQILQ